MAKSDSNASAAAGMDLEVMGDVFAVCRLGPSEPVPAWALAGSFFSVSRTEDELSVVCRQALAPAGIRIAGGWRGLKVRGPLDFAMVGVLASLSKALADAGISIFAVSTFDTDYLLVREADLPGARAALSRAGHRIHGN